MSSWSNGILDLGGPLTPGVVWFVGIAQPWTEFKERKPGYTGSLLRPAEKMMLANYIAYRWQSMPLTIDHAGLSRFGDQVPPEKRIGWATDAFVDDVHGIIVVGYLTVAHPEAARVVADLRAGRRWGLSFYTDQRVNPVTKETRELMITHLGVTEDPAWGDENAWIFDFSADVAKIRTILRRRYVNASTVLYVPPVTRRRLQQTEMEDALLAQQPAFATPATGLVSVTVAASIVSPSPISLAALLAMAADAAAVDKMDIDPPAASSPAPPAAAPAAPADGATKASSVGASANTGDLEDIVPRDVPKRTPKELLAEFKRRTDSLEKITNPSDRLEESRRIRDDIKPHLNEFGLDGIDQLKDIRKTLDDTREMLEELPKRYAEEQFREGFYDEKQYRAAIGSINARDPADDVRLMRASLCASAHQKHQSQKDYERALAEIKAKEEEARTKDEEAKALKRKLDELESTKTTMESELSLYKERIKKTSPATAESAVAASGSDTKQPDAKRARPDDDDVMEEEGAVGASGGGGSGYFPGGELANPRRLAALAANAARSVERVDMAALMRQADIATERRDNYTFSLRPDAMRF